MREHQVRAAEAGRKVENMKEKFKRLGGENKKVRQKNTYRRRREPRRNGEQQYSRANT